MLANKDAAGFLGPIASKIASFQAVPIPGHEHHDPKDLCRQVQGDMGIKDTQQSHDVTDSIQNLAKINAPVRVLICGSLYLAGEVLRANQQIPD